jgi:enolase-phosphatase E1
VTAAVVLDIEGTTSSTAHVHDVLFPYARARIESWTRDHADDPLVRDVLRQASVGQLLEWADADVKAAPLKALQGAIWEHGFASGELTSHVYPDVVPALRSWAAAGVRLYVYSSGSVRAQRAWFGHTPCGDLTPYFSGYFDLTTAGPKRDVHSYRRIADALGDPPSHITFASDEPAELDAARSAGWHTAAVTRPDEPTKDLGAHPVIDDLRDLAVTPAPSRSTPST